MAFALTAATPNLEAELRTLQLRAKDHHAYRIIESLTTEVGARLAGTEAEARARDWAVKKLKKLGFKNVKVEPVTVSGWERGAESAQILSPYPQTLSITALGGSVATPQAGLKREIVPFETLTSLEAADPKTIEGKIVFINLAMPKTQNGSGYGAVVAIRSQGPSLAATKGAAAILIRSVGTDSHRFPHTGMLRYVEDTPRIPAAALSAPDADQLIRVLAKAGNQPVMVELKLHPKDTGEKRSGNIIAEIPGETYPKEIVLVGAHLDSWDLGTGAVDDGAGVGIVTAAAKLILDHAPRKPARTIRVVLYGAEEVGLVGAFAYAKAHKSELNNHVVALESDFGAGPIYNISAKIPEAHWPMIADLQARHLAQLKIIPNDSGRVAGPDLIPLQNAKVPVISLNQDGRDYFDLHHTADDTLDKIDERTLKQNVSAYATVMWWASETGPKFRTEVRSD